MAISAVSSVQRRRMKRKGNSRKISPRLGMNGGTSLRETP
jgi:hypothetical protein